MDGGENEVEILVFLFLGELDMTPHHAGDLIRRLTASDSGVACGCVFLTFYFRVIFRNSALLI